MLIEQNFNEISDKIFPVGPGIRTLVPKEFKMGPNPKEPSETVIAVSFVVQDQSPDNDRPITAQFYMNNTYAKTRLKRLALSSGVKFNASGGFDSDELIGKPCRAVVSNESVQSKDSAGVPTGQVRVFARIDDFLIPTDAGF